MKFILLTICLLISLSSFARPFEFKVEDFYLYKGETKESRNKYIQKFYTNYKKENSLDINVKNDLYKPDGKNLLTKHALVDKELKRKRVRYEFHGFYDDGNDYMKTGLNPHKGYFHDQFVEDINKPLKLEKNLGYLVIRTGLLNKLKMDFPTIKFYDNKNLKGQPTVELSKDGLKVKNKFVCSSYKYVKGHVMLLDIEEPGPCKRMNIISRQWLGAFYSDFRKKDRSLFFLGYKKYDKKKRIYETTYNNTRLYFSVTNAPYLNKVIADLGNFNDRKVVNKLLLLKYSKKISGKKYINFDGFYKEEFKKRIDFYKLKLTKIEQILISQNNKSYSDNRIERIERRNLIRRMYNCAPVSEEWKYVEGCSMYSSIGEHCLASGLSTCIEYYKKFILESNVDNIYQTYKVNNEKFLNQQLEKDISILAINSQFIDINSNKNKNMNLVYGFRDFGSLVYFHVSKRNLSSRIVTSAFFDEWDELSQISTYYQKFEDISNFPTNEDYRNIIIRWP